MVQESSVEQKLSLSSKSMLRHTSGSNMESPKRTAPSFVSDGGWSVGIEYCDRAGEPTVSDEPVATEIGSRPFDLWHVTDEY